MRNCWFGLWSERPAIGSSWFGCSRFNLLSRFDLGCLSWMKAENDRSQYRCGRSLLIPYQFSEVVRFHEVQFPGTTFVVMSDSRSPGLLDQVHEMPDHVFCLQERSYVHLSNKALFTYHFGPHKAREKCASPSVCVSGFRGFRTAGSRFPDFV